MTQIDPLRDLLVAFFQLPAMTATSELNQKAVAKWDSLAMVQLITEMQATFQITFDLNDIEHLTTYDDIRKVLVRMGVQL